MFTGFGTAGRRVVIPFMVQGEVGVTSNVVLSCGSSLQTTDISSIRMQAVKVATLTSVPGV